MVGPQRPQFVLFGSSIVQFSFSNNGWGAILADLYARKADMFLRGYSGWNSRRALHVLHQVFPKDAVVQPSMVIVYFGGNDSILPHPSGLGPHIPLAAYVDNMRKIATHLMSLSDKTRIIFLAAPPVNEDQIRRDLGDIFDMVRTNESIQIYSEACLQLCRQMNIKAIDLCRAMQRVDNWENICFTDGIHFTAEASQIVAEEIMKVIEEADWVPSLHRQKIPTEFSEDSPYDPVSPDGVAVNVSDSNQTFN